ncbi:MAG: hypothetical protein GWO11_01630, partial [Desulfuromonadales bacterium]|nr:hypothetical protein [Desulfuromonadales bacterium]NIR33196.1 hypothetical protein [Desulfuromonadales bacterium]NIS41982.1 hypothetical protein [Desulfuromonadales bacterium]
MDFDSIMARAIDLYHSYTPFAIILLIVVVLLTIFKTKTMFRFYLFVLFMAAVFYVLSYVAESVFTGAESRKSLSTKT